MPDTEPALTYFILTVTSRGKYFSHIHPTEKETVTQRLSNLCKVTQESGGSFNIGTQEVQGLYSW